MKPKSAKAGRSVVVIGSSNTDFIVDVNRLPRPGETVLGGRFRTAGGGKGANQAIAAARAGGNVTFLAKIGNDLWGHAALETFKRERINVKHVTQHRREPSGVALIFVGSRGQNSIAVALGANNTLGARDIKRAQSEISNASIVLAQLESPLDTVVAAARAATRSGARLILNPAPARKLPRSLLAMVSVLTPNESEAALLTGMDVNSRKTAIRAANQLIRQGARTVVVTLGAQGALIVENSGVAYVPGYPVDAIDTVAAGDTFNGALAASLALDWGIEAAVKYANAAAAISVTRLGAQSSAPTTREIFACIRKSKR